MDRYGWKLLLCNVKKNLREHMDSSQVFGGSMLLLFLLSVMCLVLLVFILCLTLSFACHTILAMKLDTGDTNEINKDAKLCHEHMIDNLSWSN